MAATDYEIKKMCLKRNGLPILFKSSSVKIVISVQRVIANAPKLTPRSNILRFSPYQIKTYL